MTGILDFQTEAFSSLSEYEIPANIFESFLMWNTSKWFLSIFLSLWTRRWVNRKKTGRVSEHCEYRFLSFILDVAMWDAG
ncbi:unnamed protein product [Rhizophagus irregularis]|nr:unnamed protein product [Rhizophagus irregularis]